MPMNTKEFTKLKGDEKHLTQRLHILKRMKHIKQAINLLKKY